MRFERSEPINGWHRGRPPWGAQRARTLQVLEKTLHRDEHPDGVLGDRTREYVREEATISTLKYRVLKGGLSKGEVIHREGELC